MRRSARYLLLFSILIGTVALVDCGDDGPASGTASSTTAEGTYAGAMIGQGFAAALELTIPPPASASTRSLTPRALTPVNLTGTIELAGTTVNLTGTYDPSTQSVSFAGSSPKGDFSFRGTFANGAISGPPAQTPFGPVPLVLLKDVLGVRVYCGEISGGPAGLLGVVTAGDRAGAAYSVNGGPEGAIEGTFDGAAVTIEGGGAKVLGNVSGATLAGTFTSPGGPSGVYTASEGRCASLVAAALDGGTDAGPTDAGTDSGPPKVPETVVMTAAPGVGHLALSGGTLYYSIAHTYFSQKVEIHKVGTNGQGDTTLLAANAPQLDASDTRAVVSGLTVVGGTLYISGGTNPPGSDTTLYAIPTAGGALTTYGSMGSPAPFENYSNFAGDTVGLYRADCAGSSSVRAFTLAGAAGGVLPSLVGACAITTDGTNVFFAGGPLTGVQRVANAIATTGQPPATAQVANADDYKIDAASPSIQAMAFDATHVYWAGANNAAKKGGIWRRPKDGSGATQSIVQLPKLLRGAIAVDDTFVYFFTVDQAGQGASSATLQRVAKTSIDAPAQTIGAANPYSVVSDGSFVYYGEGQNLRRVAK